MIQQIVLLEFKLLCKLLFNFSLEAFKIDSESIGHQRNQSKSNHIHLYEWRAFRWLCCVSLSGPAGSHPSVSLRNQSKLTIRGSWRHRPKPHGGGLLQRAAGVGAHLSAAPGWAVPQQPLRGPVCSSTDAGVCKRHLRHGHRQHLRAGCPPPLQYHRVGQKHPILPRTPSVRTGRYLNKQKGFCFSSKLETLKQRMNRVQVQAHQFSD